MECHRFVFFGYLLAIAKLTFSHALNTLESFVH